MTGGDDPFADQKEAGKLKAESLARFCDAISKYAEAKRKQPELSDLLAILRRYNVIWESTDKITFDCEPGFVELLPDRECITIVGPLLCQPFFYRMNFIRQLSTTYLWKHLEATHSRLAHSLGAAQAAERFLHAIERNHPNELRDHEKRAVILYAFIHDSYHGPLGHSLELIRDLFFPTVTGRLDKYLLREALEQTDSLLHRALISFKHPEKEKIVELLKFFAHPKHYRRKFADRYFLVQILDSSFDADRVDYIRRDAEHLGKASALKQTDLEQVIDSARIVEKPESRGTGMRSLAFAKAYKERIEALLRQRAELYAEYYEHPTKMIADDMICHAIYYVMQDANVLPMLGQEGALFEKARQVIGEMSRLTDDGLFHFILECGRPFFAQLLVRDVLTNNLFGEVFQQKITFSEVKEVRAEAERLRAAFDELAEAKRKDLELLPQFDLPADDRAEIFKEVLATTKSEKAISLYFIWLLSGSGFAGRHRLERIVWERVIRDDYIKGLVRECFFSRFGYIYTRAEVTNVIGENPFEELIKYSHLHISFPSFVGTSDRTLIEYSKDIVTEKLLFYDNDHVAPEDLDVAPRGERAAAYVLVSAPRFLTENAKIHEAIRREYRKLVNSGDWADRGWLSRGYET